MSLKFGFGYGATGHTDKQHWTDKFNALSQDDKEFYGHLAYLMIGWGIGFISTETIKEIIVREKILRTIDVDEIKKMGGYEKFAEYLERFIGFGANIRTENYEVWHYRIGRNGRYDTVLGDDIAIDKACEDYEKETGLRGW